MRLAWLNALLHSVARPAAWRGVFHSVRLAWRAWPLGLLAVTAMTILIGVAPSLMTWSAWQLVNAAVAARPDRVTVAAIVLAGLSAGQFVLSALLEGLNGRLGLRIAATARAEVIDHAAHAPYGRFYDEQWRDRLGRISEEVEWRPGHASQTLLRLLANLAALGGSVGLLTMLNTWLALFAVVAAVPLVLVERRNSRALLGTWRSTSAANRRLDYLRDWSTSPDRAAETRALGVGGFLIDWHDHVAWGLFRAVQRAHRSNSRWALLAGAANIVVLTGSYLVLARSADRAHTAPATILLVLTAFGALNSSIIGILSHIVELEDSGGYLEDLYRMATEPREDLDTGVTLEGPLGGVQIHGLTFGYRPGVPVLDHVSVTLDRGSFVALVGTNGAGKTTLVKLLLGLLEPDAGDIFVAGRNLRSLSLRSWRSRVSVLFQEYGRYEMTAADSVHLSHPAAPLNPHRLADALTGAAADTVVAGLPAGLNTPVGRVFDGAHGLSGGQWQRLALARVLYRDADLYILDEPTSAMDPDMEWEVFHRIRDQLVGRTVLFVTHRMAAAAQADAIVVLDRGTVAEYGTHDALLRRDGAYARMYQTQADSFHADGSARVGADAD
jgi:ATP-binding cassette subfamily B protein